MSRMRKLGLLEISVAALLLGVPLLAVAQPRPLVPTSSAAGDRSALTIEAGSGRVVSLPGPATNVFVADPKVAEVRPASASSLFVFGVAAGRTTVAALDTNGQLVAQYEVTVRPSAFGASEAQAAVARMVRGSRVTVQATAKGLLLTGHVESAGDAAQAVAIARGYLAENQTAENQINVQSSIQVTLQVRIAEMSRQVVRNLGVNWQMLGNVGTIGKYPALTTNTNIDTVVCGAASAALIPLCAGVNFNGVIQALAQDNLAQILAEPNLTVMSGQPASFLVGGQFPVPVAQQNNAISVDFKNFGVMLSFVPTVYSDGRISVHVAPEVSEISNQNSVQVAAGNSSFVIPSLTVQRAETTVELGSGETFAIAGLLQDVINHTPSGVPFLGDIPVIGPLFRADAYTRQQIELVILVTPFVVRPVDNQAAFHLPTDNFTPPSEIERLLLLRQNGTNQPAVPVHIPGDAGFVVQ